MEITSDDLYDEFHKWCRDIFLPEINMRFSHKSNDMRTMEEIEKYAIDKCHQQGYLVRVHTSEALLGIGPLDIELTGVVPGHELQKYGDIDREKRTWETRRSVDRNEEADMRRYLNRLIDNS